MARLKGGVGWRISGRALNPSQGQEDAKGQALKVNLPDATSTTIHTAPVPGQQAWRTPGSADELNEKLTATCLPPPGSA